MRFRDRSDAGRRLAEQVLDRVTDPPLTDPVVLALPRGGVPVAVEVAAALGAPLDVLVARKVGAPGRPEYGIGAIAEGGGHVVDRAALAALGVSDEAFAARADDERAELERRVRRYRGDRALPDLAGRDVVLVDDGLATGVTAAAALGSLRRWRPRRVVVAVPAGAPDAAARLPHADQVVCVIAPSDFRAVGAWYDDFDQTGDDEVLDLLASAATPGHHR